MLHYNTANESLRTCLDILMKADELKSFRLVGGTALSLQLGHRISIDIDLFSDANYGSLNFEAIESFLNRNFNYTAPFSNLPTALGNSYLIGENESNSVKLDLYYTDSFITPYLIKDNIRLAGTQEITAMKLDVIQRGGRKKDFWDIHELLSIYSIEKMLNFHLLRYPYSHDKAQILKNLTNFSIADDDFEPICLFGKYWEFIKEDIENAVSPFNP